MLQMGAGPIELSTSKWTPEMACTKIRHQDTTTVLSGCWCVWLLAVNSGSSVQVWGSSIRKVQAEHPWVRPLSRSTDAALSIDHQI